MPDRVVECVDMHCGSITPPAHRSGILVRTSHWKAPMTRTLISSGSPFERDVAYSRAVVDGDWVFVSGTTGFDYVTMTISDDVAEQAEHCLNNNGAAQIGRASGWERVCQYV